MTTALCTRLATLVAVLVPAALFVAVVARLPATSAPLGAARAPRPAPFLDALPGEALRGLAELQRLARVGARLRVHVSLDRHAATAPACDETGKDVVSDVVWLEPASNP